MSMVVEACRPCLVEGTVGAARVNVEEAVAVAVKAAKAAVVRRSPLVSVGGRGCGPEEERRWTRSPPVSRRAHGHARARRQRGRAYPEQRKEEGAHLGERVVVLRLQLADLPTHSAVVFVRPPRRGRGAARVVVVAAAAVGCVLRRGRDGCHGGRTRGRACHYGLRHGPRRVRGDGDALPRPYAVGRHEGRAGLWSGREDRWGTRRGLRAPRAPRYGRDQREEAYDAGDDSDDERHIVGGGGAVDGVARDKGGHLGDLGVEGRARPGDGER